MPEEPRDAEFGAFTRGISFRFLLSRVGRIRFPSLEIYTQFSMKLFAILLTLFQLPDKAGGVGKKKTESGMGKNRNK